MSSTPAGRIIRGRGGVGIGGDATRSSRPGPTIAPSVPSPQTWASCSANATAVRNAEPLSITSSNRLPLPTCPSLRRDTSHACRASASTQTRARASPRSVRASTDTNPLSGAFAISSACSGVGVGVGDFLALYARTCDAVREP